MTIPDGPILIIGARSLIGRRLRDAVEARRAAGGWPQVHYTSRRAGDGVSLILDTTRPETFQPGMAFPVVIICAPVWLVSAELLQHLTSLGMRRLIAFSSTSRFTKGDSAEPAEREVVEKLATGEKSIIDFCAMHSVAYTILRPTLIYDEGHDENVSQIATFIRRRGIFPVCGAASGLRQPVHARDLAEAALQTIDAPASFNHDYNLSGAETLTYRSMVERIFAAVGKRPRILTLPVMVWRTAFAVLDIIRPQKTLKRNINMALRMNVDLWFDHADATRDFGYAPQPFKPDLTAYLSDQTASSLPDGSAN